MSEVAELFVIDAAKLPGTLRGGTDQERYEKLVESVRESGARWAEIEAPTVELMETLEAIDANIDGSGFLPVLAFANSPGRLLKDAEDIPEFGSFNPDQVHVLDDCFRQMEPEVRRLMIDTDDELLAQAFFAFEVSAAEAARRGYALAIIHG